MVALQFVGVVVAITAGVGVQPDTTTRHKGAERDSTILVPATLEAAFVELDRMFDTAQKRQIRELSEDELRGRLHMSFGMWMRNNWGLWSGSALQRDLISRGLQHPDDMSGLILTTYRRRLRGEPLNIEAEVRRYAEYWRVHAEPEKLKFAGCRSGVELEGAVGPPQPPDSPERFVHLGKCRRDGVWWAYEADRGWYRADSSLVEMFIGPNAHR